MLDAQRFLNFQVLIQEPVSNSGIFSVNHTKAIKNIYREIEIES
jgi:hypothetical protein